MPDNYWKAEHNGGVDNDGFFLHTQLSRLTIAQRSRAAMLYDDLYEGLSNRAECNNRLRDYCDKCEKANRGETFSPGRVADS